jgi:transcriptional regulator with PAS, ATPase and Fis domain
MDGTVQYVNEKACTLLAVAEKKLIGKPIQTVLHTSTLLKSIQADAPIVDTLEINGQKCIVSHMQFRLEGAAENSGIVSTIFLGNSKLTEEMSRKWFDMNQKIEFYRAEFEKRSGTTRFDQIVTRNADFERIKQDAIRISRSSSTVLLTGESGVGKSMFARGIHEASPRSGGPFVVVNCVSIPETLFESELFGYAPGAFTGALKAGKSGYFERADKGTIFMDEIGDIPLSIQAKLLQVLQDKEFERVGGTKKQSVDVRIIAATNKDLREAIVNRTFREDLYYRLNVIEFNLPALRERTEDVSLLAGAFIEKYNSILGARVSGISAEAEDLLLSYDWRGNIRELENAIEHAVNFVWEGEITMENLPSQIVNHTFSTKPHEGNSTGYRNARKDFEREMVLDALRKTNGNKSAAARLLSLSRSAFYDRLIKYGIKE